MNHINITEEDVASIVKQSAWSEFKLPIKLNEEVKAEDSNKEEPAEKPAETTVTEEHSCPLCNSKLSENISDEKFESFFQALSEVIKTEDAEDSEDDEKKGEDKEEEAEATA